MKENKKEMMVAAENALEKEAMKLHYRIKADIETATYAIYDFSESLKKMRDEKLYKELGCEEFGEYTEQWLGIKERQAYTYIGNFEKLGKEFLQSNANLGVSKLALLAAASSEEREKVMQENDVENISVKKLAEALVEIEKLKSQISFFENEKEKPQAVIQQPLDEVKAEIEEEVRGEIEEQLRAEYEDRIQELQEKAEVLQSTAKTSSGISDEEFVKFKANAEKEAKAIAASEVKKAKEESAEELKKLKADLKAAKDAEKTKEDAVKKAEDARKAAEEKAKAGEDALKRAAELEAKVKTAEAEKEAVEKQIKLSSNPELTRFKFLFEDFKRSSNSMMEQHEKLDDEKKASTLKAVKLMLEGLGL